MNGTPVFLLRACGAGLAFGMLAAALPGMAQETPRPAHGLTELSDAELGAMRGRYTVGVDQVAWFGVTMVSRWVTQAGQLQARVHMGVDVRDPRQPQVTFQPHVSITAADAPLPPASSGQRTVDAAGLANVNGMVQSVQVAGDGNVAANQADVRVRRLAAGEAPPAGGVQALSAQQSVDGMQATATLDGQAARVLLQIDGQGAVQQWIGTSGMGQSIQLAADGQAASNWMELDVARQPLPGRSIVGQNVAQAIALSRGLPAGY